MKFEIKDNDISDGYHTFTELYHHRVALYLALCKTSGFPCFYKRDYDNWFCVYLELPTGQISYHVPNEFIDLVAQFAKEDPYYKWDEHSSEDVAARLNYLLASEETLKLAEDYQNEAE